MIIMTSSLHSTMEFFSKMEDGSISFQDCWTKQADILDQCEEMLKEQIKKLQLLQVSEKEKPIITKKQNPIDDSSKVGKNRNQSKIVKTEKSETKKEEKEAKLSPKPSNSTWSIGVLSSFLQQKDEEKKATQDKAEETSDISLTCPDCGAKFVNHLHVLKDHIESVHIKVKYHCNKCNFVDTSKKKMFKHFRSHVPNVKEPSNFVHHQCGVCNGADKGSKEEILEHIKTIHNKFKDLYTSKPLGPKMRPEKTTPDKDSGKSTLKEASKAEEKINLKKIKKESSSDDKISLDKDLVKSSMREASKTEVKIKQRKIKEESSSEDVSLFISQMESKLQNYSAIINQSKEETGEVAKPKTRKKRKITTKCKYCEADFKGKPNANTRLWHHITMKHMRATLVCSKCDYEANTNLTMNKHVDETHIHTNVDMNELQRIRRDTIKYKCSECKTVCDYKLSIMDHLEREHKELLKTEIQTKDPIKKKKKVEKKIKPKVGGYCNTESYIGQSRYFYKCPQLKCSFRASIFWNLKVHMPIHVGAMFSCTLCDHSLRRKFDITEHLKENHKERIADLGNIRKGLDQFITCSCESCGFSGKSVEDFDEHMHTDHDLPKQLKS